MPLPAFIPGHPLRAPSTRRLRLTARRPSFLLRPIRHAPYASASPAPPPTRPPRPRASRLVSAIAAAALVLPLGARGAPLFRRPPSASAAAIAVAAPRALHHAATPAAALAAAPALKVVPAQPPTSVAGLPPRNHPFFSLLPRAGEPGLRNVLKCLLLAGVATALVTVVTIAVFWVIQDSLVYKPTKVWRGSPRASGMPHYDDVSYCTVDGAEISGWFIRQPPADFAAARTLVYFHGTDKNASFRLRKVIGFYETCGCNILLLSYRGYGLSTGRPNERGMRVDAESAYEYLVSRGDVDVGPGGNLWVYGESLGGAVAIHFSNVYQSCVNALILENTFTSLLDMIKLEFPILGVFRYLSRNRWQSKKRIGDLSIPLLFLSGLKDSYIPPHMMKQMHLLATKSRLKEFVEFEKGTHNRTWTMDGFYEAVAEFMDRVEEQLRSDAMPEASGSPVSGRGFDDNNRLATAT